MFGFQQSAIWGWGNPAIWVCIVVGVVLLVVFVFVERRTESPLINVRIFGSGRSRARTSSSGSPCWRSSRCSSSPASTPRSPSAKSAKQAGLYLLYFFLGFVVTSQIGGRMLDRTGAKRPVVLGCALAAVGFALWAGKVTDLNFSSQMWYIIMAGAGMGLMLGPASTDAINRASRLSYGEATGITQTVRNYAASLGFAILGTHPDQPVPVRDHHLAHQPGRARPGRRGRGVEARPAPGQRQRQRGDDPAVHPGRLRQRDRGRAVRDGDHHGGRRLVALRGLSRGVQQETSRRGRRGPADLDPAER